MLLVLHSPEHTSQQECVVVHLTLPHSEHYIWRGPDVVLLVRWDNLNAADEMCDFFKRANTPHQIRLLLVPVKFLQLVQEDVSRLFR